MDELRLILLGIGLVILVLIYLWGMRKQIRERIEERRRRVQARAPENEPQLAGDDPAQDIEVDVWSEPEVRVIRPAATTPKSSTARSSTARSSTARSSTARSSTARSSSARSSSARSSSARSADTGSGESDPDTPEPTRAKSSVAEPAAPEPAKPESVTTESATTGPIVHRPKPSAEPDPAPAEPDPPASRPDTGREAFAAGSSESRSRRRRAANEKTVLLTVMAPPGQQLRGGAIRVACESSDLVLGEGGVWECRSEATEDQGMILGIAHLREPGTFSADTLNSLETPGLLLFMHLPGPLDPVPAVDLMIAVAGRLARRLGAAVCDRKRNRMSTQAMIRLRAEAAEFESRMQASGDE